MEPDPDTMRVVNPDPPPRPLDDDARARITAIAKRQKAAKSVLMQVVTFVGGQVEDGLKLLPKSSRGKLEDAAKQALKHSYDIAGKSRGGPGRIIATDRAHRALATFSGALGGLGGLPTALAELPVATTVIFRAVQGVAETYGEDPDAEETRLNCLHVFGAGAPGKDDDGIDTSFIGARLSLSGVAVNKLLSKIAPRFATVMGQKLAGQAVPVLGAAAGAGTNYAFMRYYTEIAHVHFALRELARDHGEDQVLDMFHEELARLTLPILRA